MGALSIGRIVVGGRGAVPSLCGHSLPFALSNRDHVLARVNRSAKEWGRRAEFDGFVAGARIWANYSLPLFIHAPEILNSIAIKSGAEHWGACR